MTSERRRYFRINEAVGIAYKLIDTEALHPEVSSRDALDLITEQDENIQRLLSQVGHAHPQIAELLSAFNLKLERIASQILLDNQLSNRLAHRVHEANISACGIGFVSEAAIDIGARLALELKLYPDETFISTHGRVVHCDELEGKGFYWRVDFIGMTQTTQETLIQHVVRNQAAQLKSRRDEGGSLPE